mmetsp:Transcript_36778/g.59450  ORF Transcript_36778/g.59450 Transcript_36778/m.59450 type:complete len:288 (+) Transcript_36778:466-1329(+)
MTIIIFTEEDQSHITSCNSHPIVGVHQNHPIRPCSCQCLVPKSPCHNRPIRHTLHMSQDRSPSWSRATPTCHNHHHHRGIHIRHSFQHHIRHNHCHIRPCHNRHSPFHSRHNRHNRSCHILPSCSLDVHPSLGRCRMSHNARQEPWCQVGDKVHCVFAQCRRPLPQGRVQIREPSNRACVAPNPPPQQRPLDFPIHIRRCDKEKLHSELRFRPSPCHCDSSRPSRRQRSVRLLLKERKRSCRSLSRQICSQWKRSEMKRRLIRILKTAQLEKQQTSLPGTVRFRAQK